MNKILLVGIGIFVGLSYQQVYGQGINRTQEALNAVNNATDINANVTGQEVNYTELAENIFRDLQKTQQELSNKTN